MRVELLNIYLLDPDCFSKYWESYYFPLQISMQVYFNLFPFPFMLFTYFHLIDLC